MGEKKKLEKYRKAGKEKEYKQMLAKAKRKRKYDETSSEDDDEDDDDDDFKDPEKAKAKKKKKHKTKKSRGDVVNREFEKFSSGSESDEDGLDFESPPEDIVEDDNDLFKSDHEFSCES